MTSDSDVEPITLITIVKHTSITEGNSRILHQSLCTLNLPHVLTNVLDYGVVYPLLGYDLLALKDQHPRSPLNRGSYLLTIC